MDEISEEISIVWVNFNFESCKHSHALLETPDIMTHKCRKSVNCVADDNGKVKVMTSAQLSP